MVDKDSKSPATTGRAFGQEPFASKRSRGRIASKSSSSIAASPPLPAASNTTMQASLAALRTVGSRSEKRDNNFFTAEIFTSFADLLLARSLHRTAVVLPSAFAKAATYATFSIVIGTSSSPGRRLTAKAIFLSSSSTFSVFISSSSSSYSSSSAKCSARNSKAAVQHGCCPSTAGSLATAVKMLLRCSAGSSFDTARSSETARCAGISSAPFLSCLADSNICERCCAANSIV
mmetsp:Transcript_52135/g.93465  ORF Transcript_52135/g.93465 Transcript_52135/m.93465 type:complete len:233 (+) Transcript_52135:2872-3570(+)